MLEFNEIQYYPVNSVLLRAAAVSWKD